jgi:hypothetical protein
MSDHSSCITTLLTLCRIYKGHVHTRCFIFFIFINFRKVLILKKFKNYSEIMSSRFIYDSRFNKMHLLQFTIKYNKSHSNIKIELTESLCSIIHYDLWLRCQAKQYSVFDYRWTILRVHILQTPICETHTLTQVIVSLTHNTTKSQVTIWFLRQ